MHNTPTYRTWNGMLQRCGNPNSPKFAMYGGAGIRVCAEWRKFESFLSDMGIRPVGMTLDRIDGTKGYEKSNCRWVTPKQQQRNLKTNIRVVIGGTEKLLCEWAEELGMSKNTIQYRIQRGWTADQILSIPARSGNRVSSKAA